MLEPAPRHESERKLLLSSKSTEGIHSVCSKHQGRMLLSLSEQPWNEDQNGCCKRLGQTTKQKFRWLVEGNGGLGHTWRWGSLTRTVNFQMFKLDSEKAEEPEIKLPTSAGSSKSKRVPKKHLILLCWLCQGLCVDHNKLWKILQQMGIPDHLACLLRTLYAGQEATVRTGHRATGWFQSGKEYDKAVYCHPAYLTYT